MPILEVKTLKIKGGDLWTVRKVRRLELEGASFMTDLQQQAIEFWLPRDPTKRPPASWEELGSRIDADRFTAQNAVRGGITHLRRVIAAQEQQHYFSNPKDPNFREIDVLKLPERARNSLVEVGCTSLLELATASDEDLLGIEGFGETYLREMRSKLNKLIASL